MVRMMAALALCALGACSDGGDGAGGAPGAAPAPGQSKPLEVTQAPGDCTAAAAREWEPVAGQIYTINATASGDACAAANATLRVNTPAGQEVLRLDLSVAGSPALFGEVRDPATLANALEVWADPASLGPTTAALPEWREGEDNPWSGEFAFYPEFGMDQQQYTVLRDQARPMACFVQGSESTGCYALDEDGKSFTKIGAQSFPG